VIKLTQGDLLKQDDIDAMVSASLTAARAVTASRSPGVSRPSQRSNHRSPPRDTTTLAV